jgi:hypothetical protein
MTEADQQSEVGKPDGYRGTIGSTRRVSHRGALQQKPDEGDTFLDDARA